MLTMNIRSLLKNKFLLFNLLLLSPTFGLAQCVCTNCPLDLPDEEGASYDAVLDISGAASNDLSAGGQCLQEVCVQIAHDWVGDLELILTSPGGQSIVLFADGNPNLGFPFGNQSDNMDVCFSDVATNVFGDSATTGPPCTNDQYEDPCNGGDPCYTGTWGTWDEGCLGGNGLSTFNTGPVDGAWVLTINDNAGENSGTLTDFSLDFCDDTDIDCQSTNPSCPAEAGTNTTTPDPQILCAGTDATVSATGYVPTDAGSDPCLGWGFWVADDPLGVFAGLTNIGDAPTGGYPGDDPNFVGVWSSVDYPLANGENATLPNEENGVTYYIAPITMSECATSTINTGCFDFGTFTTVYFNPVIDYTFAIDCDNVASSTTQVDITISGGLPSTDVLETFTIINNGDGTLSTTTAFDGDVVNVSNIPDGGSVSLTVTDGAGCPITIDIGPIDSADHCVDCGADAGTVIITQTGDGLTASNNGTDVTGPFILCYGDQLSLDGQEDGVPPTEVPCCFTGPPSCTHPTGWAFVTHVDFPVAGDPFDASTSTGWLETDAGIYNGNFTDVNDGSLMDFYNANSDLPLTDNTLIFLLSTMEAVIDPGDCGCPTDVGSCASYDLYSTDDPCFDIGIPIQVTYLNPIEVVSVLTCEGIELSITGGYPEFFGGGYTITNNGAGSVSNSFPVEGETFLIENLSAGDSWNLDIVDDNGCPVTVSGSYTYNAPTIDFATLPTELCADAADITLTGTPAPGTESGSTQTSSNTTSVTITDGNATGITSTINVSGFNDLSTLVNNTDISIELDINHNYAFDLTLELSSPCGQTVTLFSNIATDDNFTGGGYIFSMSGGAVIGPDGGSPSLNTGTFLPFDDFAAFLGCNLNGDWTITAIDGFATDEGTLNGWSITLTSQDITSTAIFSGPGITDNVNTDDQGVFSPATAGPGIHEIIYTYTIDGCELADTQTVEILSLPPVGASPLTICSEDQMNLIAQTTASDPGTTINWTVTSNTGGVTGTSAGSATIDAAGEVTINQTLVNPTASDQTVTYTLQAIGPAPTNCAGPVFDVVVTIESCCSGPIQFITD